MRLPTDKANRDDWDRIAAGERLALDAKVRVGRELQAAKDGATLEEVIGERTRDARDLAARAALAEGDTDAHAAICTAPERAGLSRRRAWPHHAKLTEEAAPYIEHCGPVRVLGMGDARRYRHDPDDLVDQAMARIRRWLAAYEAGELEELGIPAPRQPGPPSRPGKRGGQ